MTSSSSTQSKTQRKQCVSVSYALSYSYLALHTANHCQYCQHTARSNGHFIKLHQFHSHLKSVFLVLALSLEVSKTANMYTNHIPPETRLTGINFLTLIVYVNLIVRDLSLRLFTPMYSCVSYVAGRRLNKPFAIGVVRIVPVTITRRIDCSCRCSQFQGFLSTWIHMSAWVHKHTHTHTDETV